MPNVALTPRDKNASATPTKRRRLLRVTLWGVAGIALVAVFLGYQQVDLAIAWISARLC